MRAFGQAQGLLGKLAEHGHINHAHQSVVGGHHRERQKFVHHKHLAGFQDGGCFRNRHNAADHDVLQTGVGRGEQQAPGGQHAYEPLSGVHHVEIDDLLGRTVFANLRQRPVDGEGLRQRRKILLREAPNRFVQVIHRHDWKVLKRGRGCKVQIPNSRSRNIFMAKSRICGTF